LKEVFNMNSIVGKWAIDPSNSDVTFSVRYLLTKVKGSFGQVEGEANVLDDISASTVYGVVDVTTISTDDEDRDAHIRSPEFFDVGNYPTITFRTNRWDKSEASDEIVLEGELTIKDVTRPVTFTGEFGGVHVDEHGNDRAELKLTTEIDRSEWGLKWDGAAEAGGVVLGDNVTIVVEAQAVRTDREPDDEAVIAEPDEPVFV
jgi:polyisoprenoid-binding protein YceI